MPPGHPEKVEEKKRITRRKELLEGTPKDSVNEKQKKEYKIKTKTTISVPELQGIFESKEEERNTTARGRGKKEGAGRFKNFGKKKSPRDDTHVNTSEDRGKARKSQKRQ